MYRHYYDYYYIILYYIISCIIIRPYCHYFCGIIRISQCLMLVQCLVGLTIINVKLISDHVVQVHTNQSRQQHNCKLQSRCHPSNCQALTRRHNIAQAWIYPRNEGCIRINANPLNTTQSHTMSFERNCNINFDAAISVIHED